MIWYDNLKGIQFDETNGNDIAKWTRGEYHIAEKGQRRIHFVTIPTARGELILRVGDWIAKDKDERFRVLRISKVDINQEIAQARNPRKSLKVIKDDLGPIS